MYHPFSIAETLKTAWGIFKKSFVTVIVYSVVTLFVLIIMGIVLGILITSDNYYVDMLVSLIIVIFQSYTTLGLNKLIFTLMDREFYEFEISQIFPRFTMLMSFLAIWFLFIAAVVTYNLIIIRISDFTLVHDIGILIGITAFLYFVLRLMFFSCYIVDEDSGPIECVKQSFALTRGHLLHTFNILLIVLALIAVPAILAKYFIIAPLFLAFSFPFVNIFVMVAYRKLIYSHQDVDDNIAETV